MTLKEIADKKLHHNSKSFINPFNSQYYGDLWPIIKWKLFTPNRFRKFYRDEPTTPVKIDWQTIRDHDGLSLTFITHAGIMIKDGDKYILVDPVFFGLAWPIRNFTPLNFEPGDMPDPDYILITHGHYDHLDKKTLKLFAKDAIYITPLGYKPVLDSIDVRSQKELDWFDIHDAGQRQITLLPCNHWSMRNPFVGPNKSLWGSYLIETSSGAIIFVSGDLGYFDHFSEIGELYDIDLAIFNLGAYEPRWFMQNSHINPAETVRAFGELNAKQLMVVHWGTFRLGDEPVHFPPIDIRREMQAAGLSNSLINIKHGQTVYWDTENGFDSRR